jgi:UDP-2-acetamido-3-amino-2,3-dideoxy-glucuronate N-acetyltransferase
MDYFVHPSAILDEGSIIQEGVKIWHFCHIFPGCEIGAQSSIGQNCVIFPKVTLGRNVKVQNNVSIYEGVICEDDVFLGPSMVFTNVYNPRSAVSRRDEYRTTLVRQGVTIGANATIVCGIEIGRFAFIGAGAVVNRNVPAYGLVVGNPARQIGWMSEFGMRLKFDADGWATCSESGQAYRLQDGVVSRVSSGE